MDNPEGSSAWPPRVVALVIVALLLAGVAFAAGLMLGREDRSQSDVTVDDLVGSTNDETDDEPAGDVADGVAVDWFAPEDQGEIDFNFYLRAWVESTDGEEIVRYAGRILGVVQNAEYEGYYLVANIVTRGGMGESDETYYLIVQQKDDRQPVLLTRYFTSGPFFGPLTSESSVEESSIAGVTLSDASVSTFERVERIVSADGPMTFSLLGTGAYVGDARIVENFSVATRTSAGDELREYIRQEGVDLNGHEHEFFMLADDGRTVWYTLNVPFWKPSTTATTGPVSIAWDNNTWADEKNYMKNRVTGCGVTSTNVVSETPELIVTGKSKYDEFFIYEPKDYTDLLVAEDYDSWKFRQETEAEATIEAFTEGHPLFYYQDQLDRWVKFTRADVILAAECGKPVIYLYPEEKTNITVKLAPQGGFSVTEPEYNGGWNVVAYPDGTLVNLADGLTYPYLFWEGRGGMYVSPHNYWVVAQEDVSSFLVTTLAKLGLNEKETADFMEFWEPRMQAAPYYKIGFHGTQVMNVIAPLSTSLKIDTLLRILMDYEELDAPIAEQPPKLPATPVRQGFTVIEWGGVIR